jgi:hypothetical protein
VGKPLENTALVDFHLLSRTSRPQQPNREVRDVVGICILIMPRLSLLELEPQTAAALNLKCLAQNCAVLTSHISFSSWKSHEAASSIVKVLGKIPVLRGLHAALFLGK